MDHGVAIKVTSAEAFTISLSVGTACQARCPYCSIPRLPQEIARGRDLIAAAERFIQELTPHFGSFRLRLTGGEVGLVPGFEEFVDWANANDAVCRVRLFTNGELFRQPEPDLSRKCRVYDHTVHDIVGDRWVRYDRDPLPRTISELRELIIERRGRCRSYRCVIIDRGTFDDAVRAALTAIDVKLVPPTGPAELPRPGLPSAPERFCFASRYLHVYDVAHDRFFHCCEVKAPDVGRACGSLTEFLTGVAGEPYPQCRGCSTAPEARSHRNAAAIDSLRRGAGAR